ncbi:double-stranded RNA-specific editase Adar-like isoform X2 [Clytia hemisphaerica]|uniref:double-stranded RNA-specific editase Adar-like isoform X2 n=1 Tax=Clytia hemisphaerica TaxID=252671 RepID=UPI0034D7A0EE
MPLVVHIELPVLEENGRLDEEKKIIHQCTIKYDGKTHGPFEAPTKMEAKHAAAAFVCDLLKLYHTGVPVKEKKKPASNSEKNCIALLHEFCQREGWTQPFDSVVEECGVVHERIFKMRYSLAGFNFPCGIGENKDVARRRAAGQALAIMKNMDVRECYRGPDPNKPFGPQIAAFSWEAFGIFCEEIAKDVSLFADPRTCKSFNLCAFLLENIKNGELRVVGMGTGKSTAKKSHRVSDGETVINSHAVVIARRSLLVFLYRQLVRLFEGRFSIFEYHDREDVKIARLRLHYKIHLYTKNPPCGDASNVSPHSKHASDHEVRNDHQTYWCKKDSIKGEGQVLNAKSTADIASCSDKILLWNFVGLQGALLDTLIEPIFMDSITITNDYVPRDLVRAFCCRLSADRLIQHPWMQVGEVRGVQSTSAYHQPNVSAYWTHNDLELQEELLNMPANGGVLFAMVGGHYKGSARDGEIPMICKRFLFMLYQQVTTFLDEKSTVFSKKTYKQIKDINVEYRKKKNLFFKMVTEQNLGNYPKLLDDVDEFYLDDNVEQ